MTSSPVAALMTAARFRRRTDSTIPENDRRCSRHAPLRQQEIASSPAPRARGQARRGRGRHAQGSVGDDLAATIGNTGTAHAGLLLADALDRAEADQLIAVVSLADGADAVIWRTTGALASRRARLSVASQAASGGRVSYSAFLTWRGFLDREPPRRPDPERPAAPPSFRREAWKFAFTGSRCQACGTRHLPPQRVCVKCQAVDRMTPERMADVPATISTYTVDRLAYSFPRPWWPPSSTSRAAGASSAS